MALKTFGKLQTGTPEALEFGFYGFRGGLNVKASPQLVGDEDLTIATNGYLRPDGAFQMRNGMNPYGQSVGNPLNIYIARFYQTIVNGTTLTTPVAYIVGQAAGLLVKIPATGGYVTLGDVSGASLNQVTSYVRFQNPDDPYYTGGLTDVIVVCTGIGGPYVWDGTNFYTPAGWADAAGAQYCAIVNGILWFGGMSAYPNQIFGSGDGIIASMETLPAYRNFVLSSFITGLQAQGTGATATLVIARNTGISVLYGTGPSTFYLQDVPFQDGIVGAMTSASGIVYMLGHMAYYSFDAQSVPQVTSKKIEPWILNDPFTPGYPMTGYQGFSWSAVYNNRVHLGYCSNSTTVNTILCLDLDTRGWTVLVPNPGLCSMVLLDGPNDPDPYECYVGGTNGQVYQWDYVSDSSPIIYDGSGATNPVLAQVQSKYFKLGVPGTNKSLQRFYPEFEVTGPFTANFTVSTDYGLATVQAQTTLNPANIFYLDVSQLDLTALGSDVLFYPFSAPLSRIDFAGIQGESFAFGVQTNEALSPWIWSGGSGVFNQRGRT